MKLLITQRAWKLLRKRGPMAPRDVATGLRISRDSAYQALRLLQRQDSATQAGNARSSRYTATARWPADTRGRHVESAMNLKIGSELNAIWARNSCGIRPTGIELERCWR